MCLRSTRPRLGVAAQQRVDDVFGGRSEVARACLRQVRRRPAAVSGCRAGPPVRAPASARGCGWRGRPGHGTRHPGAPGRVVMPLAPRRWRADAAVAVAAGPAARRAAPPGAPPDGSSDMASSHSSWKVVCCSSNKRVARGARSCTPGRQTKSRRPSRRCSRPSCSTWRMASRTVERCTPKRSDSSARWATRRPAATHRQGSRARFRRHGLVGRLDNEAAKHLGRAADLPHRRCPPVQALPGREAFLSDKRIAGIT